AGFRRRSRLRLSVIGEIEFQSAKDLVREWVLPLTLIPAAPPLPVTNMYSGRSPYPYSGRHIAVAGSSAGHLHCDPGGWLPDAVLDRAVRPALFGPTWSRDERVGDRWPLMQPGWMPNNSAGTLPPASNKDSDTDSLRWFTRRVVDAVL